MTQYLIAFNDEWVPDLTMEAAAMATVTISGVAGAITSVVGVAEARISVEAATSAVVAAPISAGERVSVALAVAMP